MWVADYWAAHSHILITRCVERHRLDFMKQVISYHFFFILDSLLFQNIDSDCVYQYETSNTKIYLEELSFITYQILSLKNQSERRIKLTYKFSFGHNDLGKSANGHLVLMMSKVWLLSTQKRIL